MSSFVRDILPVAELERQDRLPGRYPTVVRMGDDSRRGDNAVFFDDTQTVIYNPTAITTLPTTFPVSSSYISNDLKSSISVMSGKVTKVGTEQFVVLRQQIERLTPFKENRVHALDVNGTNFVSGSDVTDVGFGFSSKLRDKTILRLELPIRTTTRLVSSGGYYYNFLTQNFEPITTGSMPLQIGSTFYDQIFGQTGTGNTNEASPLLFTCLGTQLVRNYQRLQNQSSLILQTNRINTVWNHDSSFSLLQSGAYSSTGSIPGWRFIPSNKAFVVEKATFEFPFSANTEWMRDSTQMYITPDSFSAFFGVGGPALTFGFLNQISPTRRDLIMSGTVVPQSDLTPWFSYKFDASAVGALYRVLNGFTVWSTPSAVVPGTAAFTGSVTMRMNAAVANGVTTWQRSNGGATAISSINPFGRSMLEASGRSIFGREFVQPQDVLTATGSYLYNVPIDQPTAIQKKLINFDQNAASPYLLRQSDNLVIYVDTPKPALTSSGTGLPYVGSVTASYNVSINAGTMYLTLYGSEVAESTEFHDTLNQRLETNEIHEAVGFEPVVDQFDTVYSQEFSGSNFSEFNVEKAVQYFSMGQALRLSSSNETQRYYNHFDNVGDANSWSTQYQWSAARRVAEIKKSSRNIVLTSENEFFADCRLPDVVGACKVCNPSFAMGLAFVLFANENNILYTGLTSSFADTGTTNGRGCGDWMMTYPYEPKYAGVRQNFSNTFKNDLFTVKASVGDITKTLNYESIMIEVGASGRRVLGTEYDSGTTIGLGVTLPEFIKIFYGIGNGVSPIDNQHVTYRQVDANSFGQCAEIRGWKHGLHSGFPIVSTAVFRRNRYGHFRDMLEQRLDAKFVDVTTPGKSSFFASPVSVKFVDSEGKTTLPEYTYSSNLSTEYTSSQPYTDGFVRNRENPITSAKLNQSITVI